MCWPRPSLRTEFKSNRRILGRALYFGALLLGAGAAQAQNAPQSAPLPPGDPMQIARSAFETLTEAERKALQDNLLWAGFYKGGVDGEFGRMTYAAMRAFDQKSGAGKEPLPSARARASLAALADRARKAAGFRTLVDLRSGARIGLPSAVFRTKFDLPAGTRYVSADKQASLDIFRMREGEVTLQSLYEIYRGAQAGRRVTYSVIRPTFFVVASETPGGATYARVARGEKDGAPELRGFSLSWPRKQGPRFETLSVAIANSFDPFGVAAATAGRSDANASAGAKGSGLAVVEPLAPRVVASAIAVAPNRYLTLISAKACNAMSVGKRPARILKQDAQSGLALLDVANGTGMKLRAGPAPVAGGIAAVAIFAAASSKPAEATIEVATGETLAISAGNGGPMLRAPLPPEAVGGIVLSRKGEFLGLIAPLGGPRVAGAPPPATRQLVGAAAIATFLTSSGLDLVGSAATAEDQSAGKIASGNRQSVEPLFCTP